MNTSGRARSASIVSFCSKLSLQFCVQHKAMGLVYAPQKSVSCQRFLDSTDWLRRCLIWVTHLGLFAASAVWSFRVTLRPAYSAFGVPPSVVCPGGMADIQVRRIPMDEAGSRLVAVCLDGRSGPDCRWETSSVLLLRFLQFVIWAPQDFRERFICWISSSASWPQPGSAPTVRILREGRASASGQE